FWFRSAGFGGDSFTLAYGWNNQNWWSQRADMIHYGVENFLFNPALSDTYDKTFLNCYDCDPFIMYYKHPDQDSLISDLENRKVANFFWCGHGSENSISSVGPKDNDALADLSSADV